MWLHDRSLSYRKKPEFDEDDFYSTRILRDELGQHLKLFCQELPGLMKWFVENLLKMRRDIVWIEREAEKFWPMLEKEYPIWTQIACYGRPGELNWQAPGWLDKWPEELSPKALLSAARGGRLNADRTAVVFKVVRNSIRKRLVPEQESALAELRIRFAQVKEARLQASTAEPLVEPHREPRAAKEVELTEHEENIWTVIQRGSKGRQYCRELDGAGIKIRRAGIWKGAPLGYVASYDAGKSWRHRIEDEKYKIKRKAKLAELATKHTGE